jgi:hypothetical protein
MDQQDLGLGLPAPIDEDAGAERRRLVSARADARLSRQAFPSFSASAFSLARSPPILAISRCA